MYVRCAYFEGIVKSADADRFRRHIETVIVPMIRALPGNRSARTMWAREHEEGAPAFYLALEHTYTSPEALRIALASPGRDRMRAQLDEILPLFQGRVVHVNYEVVEAASS